jgi:3-oxoacyl-[acyl-carrier-protein] synthase-3
MMSFARISAIGAYVPERVLTNQDLQETVDTTGEWIVQRTGIEERRVARADEFTSDLCYMAAQDLMASHGVSLEDVDHLIVATVTPDYAFPSVAALLQHRLGIPDAGAVDIGAACAGFAHGLVLANALISSETCKKVLVIAGESLTKITDYGDRTTCILFGDGAGAALVERSVKRTFLATDYQADGSYAAALFGTNIRTTIDGLVDSSRKLRQEGRAVYKWAVSTLPKAIGRLLRKAGLSIDHIDWFVPHSANLRIIESVCSAVGIPRSKTLTSVERFGNTSAASIPLSLTPAVRDGRVKAGDKVMALGFGGGLVWTGLIFEM